MNEKLILIPIFLIGLCHGQTSEIIQNPQVDKDVIDDVFNQNSVKSSPFANVDAVQPAVLTGNSNQPCGTRPDMVCVRQYLCHNGTMDPHGGGIIEIRMSSGCNTIYEICCHLNETSDEPILNPLPRTVGCGYRNKNGVGIKISEPTDNEAEFGEFPWMVRISEKIIKKGKVVSPPKCGGSLIAPTVVLTGAHCVKSLQALNYLVRAGEWEYNSDGEPFPHQDRQVVEIIIHENFDADYLENNIALLFLETPFDDAPHIKTVCLPPVNANFDMSRCFASGWGMKQFGSRRYSNIMKKLELPVVPNAKCQNDLRQTRLEQSYELHSSLMCAGGEFGKDTCTGDGGSPLVCPMANNPDRYYQVGIVSWGIGCGNKNVPGVYASVPRLRSWIDKQLADKDIDTKFFTP
ncbi:phenoloxidase-activating factor 2-like [Episyrphus balteatus]|uniref:phenoloxidase-activating factor 2-like n=1 Tax=Episyrphus balteatus TaxID=286459 RepID=UPI00248599DE|nr:phenoloxidase-activating factor 2-like [Episyrphus balteatus]XP_055839280.1 phenoloxidase-activating factor 2-like [Episyrphus balteatus]